MSHIGVFVVNPYFSPIAPICQKIIVLRSFPNGVMPPAAIDSFLSGIILSMSICATVPTPLHFGHAPFGVLNEKLCGAGSLYAMPVSGSIRWREKYLGSFLSRHSTIITPSPCCIAFTTLFLSLCASLGFTTNLSTTTSMSWFL